MSRVEELWQDDRLVQGCGMRLLEGREGYARVSVTVEERFLNAHGIAHGGLIFTVADAAFAVSVNASQDAVGVQWSLNIFRPARLGEEIVAESRVIHDGRRSMVCELSVTNGEGRLLARGQATALPLAREHSDPAPSAPPLG